MTARRDRSDPTLTPRQTEVLHALARGLAYKEVAQRLRIDKGTVRGHVTNAFERLGVESSIEAFLALGWLAPPREI